MTLALLRSRSQVFPRMFLSWDLSDVLLMIQIRVVGFGEQSIKCCFLSRHIKDT